MNTDKISILAIDDNEVNLQSLGSLLKEVFPDAELLTALNGEEGIKLAGLGQPDVILLPISAAALDCPAICRRLKSDPKLSGIPLVFMTENKCEKASRIQALECGAEAFLLKPIDETDFALQIRAMVKIRKANFSKHYDKDRLAEIIIPPAMEPALAALRQAEAELREKELQYHNLANAGITLTWTSGTDKLCNYFNGAWLKFTGRSLEQEMGNGWTTGVHPADLDQCFKTYISAFEKRESFDMEYRLRHVSGEYRWIRDIGTPNYDGSSEFIGYIGNCFDITEQKHADEALRQSEERYRYMFANNPQPMWIYDAETLAFLEINNAAVYHYGYTREEFLSMSIKDIRPPEDVEIILKHVKQPRQAYNHAGEWRHVKKNGDIILVEIISQNINFQNRQAWHVMIMDITESKMAKEALVESERLLRESQTIAGLGSYIWNISSGLWKSSKILDEIFGIDKNYIHSLAGWVNIIHPDWRKHMTDYVTNEVIGQHQKFDKEYKIIRQDNGQERWVHGLGNLEPDNIERSLVLIGTISDITGRKLAEEALRESELRFRLLFDKAPLGYQSLDINGNFIDVNQAWLDTLGYTSEEVIGKWFGDFLAPKYKDAFRKRFPIFKAEGKIHSEFEMVHKIGYSLFMAFDGRIGKDLEGNFKQTHCILKDITDQKLAEEEIKKLNFELEKRVSDRTAQLVAANKEMEAFSYSVSHDLRAPLRAIHGFTQILVEDYAGKLDDEGKRICSVIQDNSLKMGQLIDDLLAFSRLSRAEMQHSVIDMKKLVYSVFHEVTDIKSRERIILHIGEIDEILADPNLMRQVWVNLLSNAVKFSSGKEKALISVSSVIENGKCTYCITDNGAGFDMKYAAKLFGVFQRLHSMKEFEGTGVGLAIVQRIVFRHGGEVWAQGEVNKGASFYFTLPVPAIDPDNP